MGESLPVPEFVKRINFRKRRKCVSRRIVCCTIIVALFGGSLTFGSGTPAKADSRVPIQARLLRISDLPHGWIATSSGSSGKAEVCGSTSNTPQGDARVVRTFVHAKLFPTLTEVLETGPSIDARFIAAIKQFRTCKTISESSGNSKISGHGGELSFPSLGLESKAFAYRVATGYGAVGIDLVIFRYEGYLCTVILTSLGAPNYPQLEQLTRKTVTEMQK